MLEIGSNENTVNVKGIFFRVLYESARRKFMILYKHVMNGEQFQLEMLSMILQERLHKYVRNHSSFNKTTKVCILSLPSCKMIGQMQYHPK